MPSTPVLFLDIDGVLNSAAYFDRLPKRGLLSVIDSVALFDPLAIGRLNRICAEASPLVILSSAWRETHALEDIGAWMRQAGFAGTLAGKTPVVGNGWRRHLEIEKWLDMNNLPRAHPHVAIDDDPGPLGSVRWVITSYQDGLTAEKASEVISAIKGGTS